MDTNVALRAALVELLPAMVADGGGAEIVQVGDDWASVRLTGTCLFCPSRKKSALALEEGLKRRVACLRRVFVEYPPLDRTTATPLIAIRF